MLFRLNAIALVFTGLLLSSTAIHGQPSTALPGGAVSVEKLPEGTTLKLKVTDVFIHGGKKAPGWIPKLRKGQSVKVRIGKDGRLVLLDPRFGIPLAREYKNVNSYERPVLRTGRAVRTASATLLTKPSDTRSKLQMTFGDTFFKDPGQQPIDIGVVYDLD